MNYNELMNAQEANRLLLGEQVAEASQLNDDLLRSVVDSIASDGYLAPEAASRRIELISLIQFALDQLPEHYATALELKYIEGFSSQEIAQRLQVTDEAIQSILARARRAFREVCGEALHTARQGTNYE